MRAAAEHGAERPDELALIVEDDHCIGALAAGMYCLMNVDVALRILNDAVGIAVFDVGRQITPIVNGFVLVFAFPQDGMLCARFIIGPDERGGGSGSARGEKIATSGGHGH